MKDIFDKKTIDFLAPARPPRGRPLTGEALTSAERQAKYRKNNVTVTLKRDEWSCLIAFLQASLASADRLPAEQVYDSCRKFFRAGVKSDAPPSEFSRPVTYPPGAMYADPSDPTKWWSGKGRVPLWLDLALMDGKKKQDFLII